MTNLRNTVAALSILGLASLSSPATATVDDPNIRSSETPRPADAALAQHYEIEASKTHETIAEYYEAESLKMREKAQEQRRLFEQYTEKSYLHGKQAQDLQGHAAALAHKYEQAAKADASVAVSHRQIASKLRGNHATASGISKINESRR